MPGETSLGQLLLRHLGRQERSAAWLAAALGVHRSTVGRWINGESRPRDAAAVRAVARVLRVSEREELRRLYAASGFLMEEERSGLRRRQMVAHCSSCRRPLRSARLAPMDSAPET